MKIGLWTDIPKKINGCYKVVMSLKKGLDELGQEYVENELGDVNGCLQGAVKAFRDKSLPPKTLIGPEIVVLPTETDGWIKYKNWCQPSQWVIDYMKIFKETKNTRFYPWAVGIDTEEFNANDRNPNIDCFIYYKNVTKQTPVEKLNYLKRYLENKKMTYVVLEYGKYKEDELKNACNSCKFGILLTGTESQGIGLMEMMSMDVPLYVIDETTFLYNEFTFEGASSAPYFGKYCGIKHSNLDRLSEFMDDLSYYRPRDYILENHTCAISAKKYVKILEKCYGV